MLCRHKGLNGACVHSCILGWYPCSVWFTHFSEIHKVEQVLDVSLQFRSLTSDLWGEGVLAELYKGKDPRGGRLMKGTALELVSMGGSNSQAEDGG